MPALLSSSTPPETARPAPHPAPTGACPPECSASTLALLSTSDERLLETYLRLNSNLDALAAQTKTPILHLLRWLNQPHVQRYLDALDTLRARQHAAQHAADRRAALDALKQVLSDSHDPTEKRRAAATILRALRPLPDIDDRPWRNAAAPGRLRPRISSRRPLSASSHPTSDIAHPTSLPSPDLSAYDLLESVLSTLREHPDDDDSLAALHALCAPRATIAGQPIPDNATDFIDDLDQQIRKTLTDYDARIPHFLGDSPTTAAWSYDLCRGRAVTVANFHLRRDSPSHPFLIESIAFPDSS